MSFIVDIIYDIYIYIYIYIYIFEASSTFTFGFYIFICSFICSTMIFKSSFCKTTCGVSVSLSTCYILIFSFGFFRFSFKLVFCKKSFKLDLFSSTFICRFVVFNTTSIKPKNFEHSCK